jgi:hypothetical protein
LAQLRWIAIQIIAALGLLLAAAENAAAQAHAANDEYAKTIENAVLEFDSGNWPEARVLFEQAHALRPSARTLRGMGKVSFELKEYVRAQKELNASLVELRSPLSEAQRKEVLALLQRAEKYIGKLAVHVKPEAARPEITLDGSKVEGEQKLDLGQHELAVQASGYRPLTRNVSIEGGKTLRLELTLTPMEPDSSVTVQPSAAGADLTPSAAALAGQTDQEGGAAPTQQPRPSDQRRAGVLQKWWFWTIVGAVVVGGTVTAIALTTKSTTEPPMLGNTGVAVQALTWAH